MFNSVAGQRPILEKAGDKAGKNHPATAMGRYFKPELSQNLKNSYFFFNGLRLTTYFAMSWPSLDFIRQISSEKSRAQVLQVGFKL